MSCGKAASVKRGLRGDRAIPALHQVFWIRRWTAGVVQNIRRWDRTGPASGLYVFAGSVFVARRVLSEFEVYSALEE